jgi:hypothetical protein
LRRLRRLLNWHAQPPHLARIGRALATISDRNLAACAFRRGRRRTDRRAHTRTAQVDRARRANADISAGDLSAGAPEPGWWRYRGHLFRHGNTRATPRVRPLYRRTAYATRRHLAARATLAACRTDGTRRASDGLRRH